jgi:hypothetical protein
MCLVVQVEPPAGCYQWALSALLLAGLALPVLEQTRFA